MPPGVWAHHSSPAEPPPRNVPRGDKGPEQPATSTARPILKRPLPRKGRHHKHNPNSRWTQKRSLYQKGRDEVKDLYDNHTYRDPELGEVVALKESVLLDVEKGEILGRGVVYQRKFDVFNRR